MICWVGIFVDPITLFQFFNLIFTQLRTQSVVSHRWSGIVDSAGHRWSFHQCFLKVHPRRLRTCNKTERYCYVAGNTKLKCCAIKLLSNNVFLNQRNSSHHPSLLGPTSIWFATKKRMKLAMLRASLPDGVAPWYKFTQRFQIVK